MKVAVIGGGIAGLDAAYDLAGAGHRGTSFEAAPYTGGRAAGFQSKRWACHLEPCYHQWFEIDDDILNLIDVIGERDKVFFPRPITSLFVDGQTYPFDSPMRVLRFPKLPLIDKLRFGLVTFYLRLTKNWQALEKETVNNWYHRALGERAYKILMEPLLVGKFGDYYKEVNMAWMWARLHKRMFKLGYFEGGVQAFVDALTQTDQARGGRVCLQTKVTHISPQPDGSVQVHWTADGKNHTQTCDRA